MHDVDVFAHDDWTTKRLREDYDAAQAALSPEACRDNQVVRRTTEPDHPAYPQFVRDAVRILNCRYYNRYADKTQAFSLYQNDDITRRMQHVQIVSRIARSIGRMLKLNQDLIEAIALGHDLGHTPFGHLGERILSGLLQESAGVPFRHNVQGVRVADRLLDLNLSIQTLDGILCHNGRPVRGPLYPNRPEQDGPAGLEGALDCKCSLAGRGEMDHKLVALTLEGCVVRFADAISYIRKDRQDAVVLGVRSRALLEHNSCPGMSDNAFVISMMSDLVKNSYGKPYLCLGTDAADILEREKSANFELIYSRQNDPNLFGPLERMFERVYTRCVTDVRTRNKTAPVWRHHICKTVSASPPDETKVQAYLGDGPEQIAADYIASMTDDYFMELHEFLFPGTAMLRYESYFHEE